MPVFLDHFISGILITTPPFIYIFVGNDPGSSLVEVVTIPRDSDDFDDVLPNGVDERDEEESITPPDTSKNGEINEKLGKVGIDKSCFLQDLHTAGICKLNLDQLKLINFPDKEGEDDSDFEITGLEENETVTLTVEIGYEENDFPQGVRLTFHNYNSKDINITGGFGDTTLKPEIDYDYKFSYAKENGIDKAWSSLQKLGAKVGLNINNSVSDDCVTGEEIKKEINVWRSVGEYVIGAQSSGESHCLMKATEENENHLEGYRLSVRGSKDISLTGGTGPKKGTRIDGLKKDAFYSIGPKDIRGRKVWFLIENS